MKRTKHKSKGRGPCTRRCFTEFYANTKRESERERERKGEEHQAGPGPGPGPGPGTRPAGRAHRQPPLCEGRVGAAKPQRRCWGGRGGVRRCGCRPTARGPPGSTRLRVPPMRVPPGGGRGVERDATAPDGGRAAPRRKTSERAEPAARRARLRAPALVTRRAREREGRAGGRAGGRPAGRPTPGRQEGGRAGGRADGPHLLAGAGAGASGKKRRRPS